LAFARVRAMDWWDLRRASGGCAPPEPLRDIWAKMKGLGVGAGLAPTSASVAVGLTGREGKQAAQAAHGDGEHGKDVEAEGDQDAKAGGNHQNPRRNIL
jgi:hypothetical protein